jgi:plastocyanin
VLVATLTTGHYIAMGIVAVVFVGFALICSFVLPRSNPDFPGKAGIGVFAIACVVLFAAQLTSVLAFGVEKGEAKGEEAASVGKQGSPRHTITVGETEFKLVLPALKTLPPGSYTFEVTNNGKVPHNLAIRGPKFTGPQKTPTIAPGKSAKLTVSLEHGTYQLYCSIPGHEKLGMTAKISVG